MRINWETPGPQERNGPRLRSSSTEVEGKGGRTDGHQARVGPAPLRVPGGPLGVFRQNHPKATGKRASGAGVPTFASLFVAKETISQGWRREVQTGPRGVIYKIKVKREKQAD